MDSLDSALGDLAVAASSGNASLEDLFAAVRGVIEEANQAEGPARNKALRRMADIIESADVAAAGVVAIGCGALVEAGSDPHLALNAILTRLPETLEAAAVFAEACQAAAPECDQAHGEADGELDEDEEEWEEADEDDVEVFDEDALEEFDDEEEHACQHDPIAAVGAQIAEEMPDNARAWEALEPLCMGAIAMLSRSPAARKMAGQDAELLAQVEKLSEAHGRVHFLSELLQVLDGEELIVLHPGAQRGYRVQISGIADNFQLHTLLADALIGSPKKGLLPGKRPDPEVVAAARDQPATEDTPHADGVFNLVNWTGLQPDGTLSEAYDGSEHWIWNEGVPADIRSFEGTHVVLLGPPPYSRSWNGGRKFDGMTGELKVLEILKPEAVQDWLARIVKAVKKRPRKP